MNERNCMNERKGMNERNGINEMKERNEMKSMSEGGLVPCQHLYHDLCSKGHGYNYGYRNYFKKC